MKTVGITGAVGNLGTTLTSGLKETYDLKLFDIKERNNVHKVDFADPANVKGCFDGLDAIIHLAGDPRVGAPYESTYRNNFLALSVVFEEAYRAGIKKIVFASSNFYHEGDIGMALRGGGKRMIKLSDDPTPQSLYGHSKVYGEAVGRHYSHLGVKFVALRIGWSVPSDDPRPYAGPYMAAVFCSHRDLVQAFDKALQAEDDFLAAFAVSDNTNKVFDLAETSAKLGFEPVDNYGHYFDR